MSLFRTTARAFQRRRHPFTWKRRWRLLILDWLGREEPPERVAAALALGVGVGFSPFLGLHLLLALGLAFLLRLNRLDAVIGQFVGNPWTIPPVYALGYRLGRWLLRYDSRHVPRLNWAPVLESDWIWLVHPVNTARQVFGGHAFVPRLLSFFVGTTTIAVAIAFSVYFAMRAALALFRSRHPGVVARAARRREITDPPPRRASRDR